VQYKAPTVFDCAVSLGPCHALQNENLDLTEAVKLADDVLAVIGAMRANVETVFAELFASVAQLGSDVNIQLVKPRLSNRQTNRCNIVSDSDEDYFMKPVLLCFIVL